MASDHNSIELDINCSTLPLYWRQLNQYINGHFRFVQNLWHDSGGGVGGVGVMWHNTKDQVNQAHPQVVSCDWRAMCNVMYACYCYGQTTKILILTETLSHSQWPLCSVQTFTILLWQFNYNSTTTMEAIKSCFFSVIVNAILVLILVLVPFKW